MKKQQRYISYLLRLWQVRHDGEPVWRASLESPRTGKQHGFARLTDLVAFLETKMSGGNRDNANLPDDQIEDEKGNTTPDNN
jgi:hypothetical protein